MDWPQLAYKPVVVKSSEELLGKTLRVKVTEASQTYLKGKLLRKKTMDWVMLPFDTVKPVTKLYRQTNSRKHN